MFKLVERLSDRVLSAVVPKVEARASECACDPGSQWWGSYCGCYIDISGSVTITCMRRILYTCKSDCRTSTNVCKCYSANC